MKNFYWVSKEAQEAWSRLFLGEWISWSYNKEHNGAARLAVSNMDEILSRWHWAVQDIFGMDFVRLGGEDVFTGL